MATFSAANVQKFIWKKTVCRFRIPNTLVFDKKKKFIDKGVEEFLKN